MCPCRGEERLKDLSIDESIDDPKPSRSRLEEEFAEWYAEYPRKEAKAIALKAFVKVRKDIELKELLAGLNRYAEAMRGKDRKFIALPATWLNAGRWADEFESSETHTTPNPYNPSNW